MSDDTIKRSDAIKALNREKSDWNCDYNVPIDNCIKRLNKVKSADRPQGEWIPCSKKMPNEGDRIVVQYADGSLGLINSCRMRIWNISNSPYSKVVAWMYIEPWKGADDE